MSRRWLWLQLVIGWLPVGALFVLLIMTAHPDAQIGGAVLIALRMMLSAALLGFAVHRVTRRWPWPRPMRASFVARHVIAAGVYAVAFVVVNSLIESLVRGHGVIVVGTGFGPFLVLGVWLYVMIGGVSYADDATSRAAYAEALAARSQLAALRAQLHPHFLFNALHTVVQLIPRDPTLAAEAAEQVAFLLRTTLEEDRDRVTLGEELAFVRRYLALERIRFGERLTVREDVPDEATSWFVPSFCVLTLVENAVRHGAAPKIGATSIWLTARVERDRLVLQVRDDGAGAPAVTQTPGTGLRRLRDRLGALHGAGATLNTSSPAGGGFAATLTVPGTDDE